MNDNGNTQTNVHPPPQNTLKSRKGLGRGLKEILESQYIHDMQFDDLPQHIKAARISAVILELVDCVDSKYHPVIFKSVTAFQTVSQLESTEAIGQKLSELEQIRIRREQEILKPKRRWYFFYLR